MKNKKILSLILAILCSSLAFGIFVMVIKYPAFTIPLLIFGTVTFLFYDIFEGWFCDR